MCTSEFSKILLTKDKMILCREKDFEKLGREERQQLIRKAFPELANRLFKLFSLTVWIEIRYKIERCYKMYSSQFYCQIAPLERENNWDECPFIAFWVFKENNETFCGAKPVSL